MFPEPSLSSKASIVRDIPSDWKARQFKDVSRVVRGASPRPAGSPLYFDGDYLPWITVADVTKDENIWLSSTRSCLTRAGAEHTRVTEPGTLLLTNSGATLGVPKISKLRAGANDGIAMIIDLVGVDPLFLYYYLSSKTRYFREILAPGVGQPNLNTDIIGNLPLPVPPLGEQQAIANVLRCWDEAIDLIRRLIENSKQQKRAVMRRLLRPKGCECWQERRLADVAEIYISNVDKKSRPGEQQVQVCNYTDVYYNDYITSDLPFMVATATRAQIERFSLRRGDILITKDSETPDDIAVPAMVAENLDNVLCGYHLAIIRPNAGIDSTYLRSLFSLHETQRYFFTRANGATRFGLTVDAIRNAVLSLPSLEQQQEAAKTIKVAEEIVRRYEEDLARLKKEKTALMQQLLTGKRRIRLDTNEMKIAAG